MRLITSITSKTYQTFQIPLIDGSGTAVNLSLQYLPYVNQWNMNMGYIDTVIEGIRIVESINILNQWKYILPFGLRCLTIDGGDPILPSDWKEGVSRLYILDTYNEIFTQF